MKPDASERESGRRELAQYVRIAPMDFERSLVWLLDMTIM